jgi:hypothetical protein
LTYATRFDAFCTVPSGSTLSATNIGGIGISVSLTAGSYTITQFVAHVVARLNATAPLSAVWTGSVSYTTGLVTLASQGTWALTFTTAAAGTLMGFVGDIASRASAATGTQNARGLYIPDCPVTLEGDPASAGKVTDLRSTVGPTGSSFSMVGTKMYRHKSIRCSHVARARMFEANAATTYASWQQWLDDTQFGDGHSWFSVGSAFQLYWDNNGTAAIVGASLNAGAGPTAGWCQSGLTTFEPRRAHETLLAYWEILIPQIVTSG